MGLTVYTNIVLCKPAAMVPLVRLPCCQGCCCCQLMGQVEDSNPGAPTGRQVQGWYATSKLCSTCAHVQLVPYPTPGFQTTLSLSLGAYPTHLFGVVATIPLSVLSAATSVAALRPGLHLPLAMPTAAASSAPTVPACHSACMAHSSQKEVGPQVDAITCSNPVQATYSGPRVDMTLSSSAYMSLT